MNNEQIQKLFSKISAAFAERHKENQRHAGMHVLKSFKNDFTDDTTLATFRAVKSTLNESLEMVKSICTDAYFEGEKGDEQA